MHGDKEHLWFDNGFGRRDRLNITDPEWIFKDSVLVVLLLVCHSGGAADTIFKANEKIEHIISIQLEKEVTDEACLIFSKEFYGNLYKYLNS